MILSLNGVQIHYEDEGSGAPLLFLHGNGEDLSLFTEVSQSLKSDYRVIRMDSRGHGESSAVAEYHYEDMAQDCVALFAALHLTDITLVGFSDGAIVALMAALKQPQLIRQLILCGLNIDPSGMDSSSVHYIEREFALTKDDRLAMMLREPQIAAAELTTLTCPVKLVYGEDDLFTKAHVDLITDSFTNCERITMTGADHMSYVEDQGQFTRLIKKLLQA